MGVAHDPDDRQQAQVAVHVSELDRAADRVLAGPALARERLADHGDVRRVGAVAVVEDAPANEGNPEDLEVAVGRRRRNPRRRGAPSAGRALPSAVHRSSGASSCVTSTNIPSGRPPSSGRPLVAPTLRTPGICLSRSIRREKKIAWPALALRVLRPRQRDVHRDDLVHAETGIHLEHLHQAAAEQPRADHEHQRDRDLRRHDDAARCAGCPASRPARARPLRGPRAGPRTSRARR